MTDSSQPPTHPDEAPRSEEDLVQYLRGQREDQPKKPSPIPGSSPAAAPPAVSSAIEDRSEATARVDAQVEAALHGDSSSGSGATSAGASRLSPSPGATAVGGSRPAGSSRPAPAPSATPAADDVAQQSIRRRLPSAANPSAEISTEPTLAIQRMAPPRRMPTKATSPVPPVAESEPAEVPSAQVAPAEPAPVPEVPEAEHTATAQVPDRAAAPVEPAVEATPDPRPTVPVQEEPERVAPGQLPRPVARPEPRPEPRRDPQPPVPPMAQTAQPRPEQSQPTAQPPRPDQSQQPTMSVRSLSALATPTPPASESSRVQAGEPAPQQVAGQQEAAQTAPDAPAPASPASDAMGAAWAASTTSSPGPVPTAAPQIAGPQMPVAPSPPQQAPDHAAPAPASAAPSTSRAGRGKGTGSKDKSVKVKKGRDQPTADYQRLSERPAVPGWRRTLRKTKGLFRSDDTPERLAASAASIQAHIATGRRVVVVGACGGAGTTSTVAALTHTLTRLRNDRTAVASLARDRSALARRIGTPSTNLNLDTTTVPTDDKGAELLELLSRSHAFTFADLGTHDSHPALVDAHVVVVVTSASLPGVDAATQTISELVEQGVERRRIVLAPTDTGRDTGLSLKQVVRALEPNQVTTQGIPSDRHLAGAAAVNTDLVSEKTQVATYELAGVVVQRAIEAI